MNCLNTTKCILGVVVALSFAPQPKVMASTFRECQEIPNQIFPENTVVLNAVDIFGTNLVEQSGTQEQGLSTASPYKVNTSDTPKDVIWRMRIYQKDYVSFVNQGGRSVTYNVPKQYQPSRLKVESVGNIEKYKDCLENSTEPTVLIKGTARLVFGELNKWTAGDYRPVIEVCIPGIKCN